MAKTVASIVETSRGKRVRVTTPSGHVDWPVLYDNGRIGYDFPERVPQYIRPKVMKLLRQLKSHNK